MVTSGRFKQIPQIIQAEFSSRIAAAMNRLTRRKAERMKESLFHLTPSYPLYRIFLLCLLCAVFFAFKNKQNTFKHSQITVNLLKKNEKSRCEKNIYVWIDIRTVSNLQWSTTDECAARRKIISFLYLVNKCTMQSKTWFANINRSQFRMLSLVFCLC